MNYPGQVLPSFVMNYSYGHHFGMAFSITVIQTMPSAATAGMYLDSPMLYFLSKTCSGHNIV